MLWPDPGRNNAVIINRRFIDFVVHSAAPHLRNPASAGWFLSWNHPRS